MKTLLPPLLAFLFFAGTASAAPSPGPGKITLSAKMGEVAFPHAQHQKELKIACEKCHHTGYEPVAKCKSCHETTGDAPRVRDAFHNLCKGCHLETDAGPTDCKECHRK